MEMSNGSGRISFAGSSKIEVIAFFLYKTFFNAATRDILNKYTNLWWFNIGLNVWNSKKGMRFFGSFHVAIV